MKNTFTILIICIILIAIPVVVKNIFTEKYEIIEEETNMSFVSDSQTNSALQERGVFASTTKTEAIEYQMYLATRKLTLDKNRVFAQNLGVIFEKTENKDIGQLLEHINSNLNFEIFKLESSFDTEFIELIKNPSEKKITTYLKHTFWNDKYSLGGAAPTKAHVVSFKDGTQGVVFYFTQCCGGISTNLFFYKNDYIYQLKDLLDPYAERLDTSNLSYITFVTPNKTFLDEYIANSEKLRSNFKTQPIRIFKSSEIIEDGVYVGLIDGFKKDVNGTWTANVNFLSFKDEVTYPDVFMRYQNNTPPKTFYDSELYMTHGTLLDITNKSYSIPVNQELIAKSLSIIANNQEGPYTSGYTYAVLLGADNNGFDPLPDEKRKKVTDDFLSKSTDTWVSVFATTDATMDMFDSMQSRHQAFLYRSDNTKMSTEDIRKLASVPSPKVENLLSQINRIDLKHGYSSKSNFETIVRPNNSFQHLKLDFPVEQLKENPLYWFVVKNGTITQFQGLMGYRP